MPSLIWTTMVEMVKMVKIIIYFVMYELLLISKLNHCQVTF